MRSKPQWFEASRMRMFLAVLFLCALAGCGHSAPPAPYGQERGEIDVQAAAQRYDLGRDEERGGHTLEKHVGQSDEQLRERLNRETNITAASTWTDRAAAEITVADTLRAERGRVDSWMRRGGRRTNLALHYDAGRVIGRSLRRGQSAAVDCTRAVIVLRADGPNGFYVLTAYPEA